MSLISHLRDLDAKYSIWMIPENGVFQKFRQIIEELGETHGGPVFDPHITLLSGIRGDQVRLERTKDILKEDILPLKVKLNKVEFQDVYFRSMYLKVEDNNILKSAYEKACKLFRKKPAEFFPHLSLIYGVQDQGSIASTLGNDLFLEFSITDLKLVDTSKPVEEWKLFGTTGNK